MNISITSKCNKNCAFCFQNEWYKNNNLYKQNMTVENFIKILNWSGVKKVGIMGGEPLLHSNIIEILYECKKTNVLPKLMTNLSCSSLLLENIINKALVDSWLINGHYENKELFYNNLKLLQNCDEVVLAYTLLPKENVNHKIIDYIIEASNVLNKEFLSVRLSPSTPYGEIWKEYDYTKDILHIINTVLSKKDVFFGFDCQVNGCELSIEVQETFKQFPQVLQFKRKNCNNNPVFDILVDNSAIWCSSASFLKLNNIFDFKDLTQAKKAMIDLGEKYWINNKAVNKCIQCSSYRKQCNGLCIARHNVCKNE